MKVRCVCAWLVVAILSLSFASCGSVVPPGKKVIILKPNGESMIIEKGVYRAWGRDRMYFVDQKLKSFTEDKMQILCADDINMTVDVKTVLSFDVSKESIEFIKQKIPAAKTEEGEELSLDKFYEMAIRDIVRSSARNVVSVEETDNVRPNRQQIEADIGAAVVSRLTELKYPVKVSASMLSNIDYPQSVTQMRERIKQAELHDQELAAEAEALLAEAQRQVAIEQENAKVRMVKAQAQADENEILTKSLTPEFLMWRQLEVLETTAAKLAEGASNTVFMMPYQTMTPELMNTAMIKTSVDNLRVESGGQ